MLVNMSFKCRSHWYLKWRKLKTNKKQQNVDGSSIIIISKRIVSGNIATICDVVWEKGLC